MAKCLNRLYRDCPVLKAEAGVKRARLELVSATADTLKKGLWLLGIDAPKMRGEQDGCGEKPVRG